MRSGFRAGALLLTFVLPWALAPLGEAGVAAKRRPPAEALPLVQTDPGTVVRWSVPGTRTCGMGGRTWRAVEETCYYPLDVARNPGIVMVVRHGARGSVARARVEITTVSFGSEHVDLGDIPQAHPSRADLRRNAREQALLATIWRKPEGPAQFTLPLGRPLDAMPEAKGFGATWIFDTTPPATERHAGIDYAVRAGAPVLAMADGRVALARDLFYSGRSVVIDHGDGLFTEYLHLSDVTVRSGQEVRKGERIGLVGDTGRTTGPHLHLGVHWHGARIDPRVLLEDPAKIPAIGEGRGAGQ